MRITHRVTFFEPEVEAELKSLGIVSVSDPFEFTMTEDDPRWVYVEKMIPDHDVLDIAETTFTQQELKSAELLIMEPSWHCGYPQPQKDFGFLKASYDLTEYCENCGMGARQNAPLQLKSEPKWGKRSIMQLNWIFDEFFATPEAWSTVFKRFGVQAREVVQWRSGSRLQTVEQLDVGAVAPCNLKMNSYPSQTCEACHRIKYLPVTRGAFPPLQCEWLAGAHMAKSVEYFGDGARAFAAIIVSQELFRAVEDAGLSGVGFWPLQSLS